MRRIWRSLYITVNNSFFSSLKLTWKQLSAVSWSWSSMLEALVLQARSTQRNIGKNWYNNCQRGNGPFQTYDQYNDELYSCCINCWYTGEGRKCSFNIKGNGKGKCKSNYSCKQLYLTVSTAAASESSLKKNSGKHVKECFESPEVVMQKRQKLTNCEEFSRFPVWIRLLGWLTNSIRRKIQPDCLGKNNGILARSKAVLGPCQSICNNFGHIFNIGKEEGLHHKYCSFFSWRLWSRSMIHPESSLASLSRPLWSAVHLESSLFSFFRPVSPVIHLGSSLVSFFRLEGSWFSSWCS